MDKTIDRINDHLWNLRTFIAWSRSGPDPGILDKYGGQITSVPLSEANADMERRFSYNERLLMAGKVTDIPELNTSWPLLELKTEDDVFAAQVEFLDTAGVRITARPQRVYPYRTAAAQTIGWVGPPQAGDKALFSGDSLGRYLSDELCGREDGTEHVCEAILRGRRGERAHDIEGRLMKQTFPVSGRDVRLTIDIELQGRIEQHLLDCSFNPNCGAPSAVVVMDIDTSEVLALVSVPVFDLNDVRSGYERLASDPKLPLLNRAINRQYPPGSVVKPLILVAGLETGSISPEQVISCPSSQPRNGWPGCWIYNQFRVGHDDVWSGQGGNYSRNAVRGSCNIYFSQLAERIEPRLLQWWLYAFGYGRPVKLAPDLPITSPATGARDLRQAPGRISTAAAEGDVWSFEQIPSLQRNERRYFGIGQGSLRVTPLQVAGSMAALARGGIYRPPRLFIERNKSAFGAGGSDLVGHGEAERLQISKRFVEIVLDGMEAAVSEPGGTAYEQFAPAAFGQYGVRVYGKTGSTERPDHAWFAGLAVDVRGLGITVVVVVEGAQRGSADAAPIGRDIIEFCMEAGYLEGSHLNY
jgi:penicillin-binding protein 2